MWAKFVSTKKPKEPSVKPWMVYWCTNIYVHVLIFTVFVVWCGPAKNNFGLGNFFSLSVLKISKFRILFGTLKKRLGWQEFCITTDSQKVVNFLCLNYCSILLTVTPIFLFWHKVWTQVKVVTLLYTFFDWLEKKFHRFWYFKITKCFQLQ